MNRLQYEKSPYLLQHANNPVDWYPWCEKAFITAKEKDKPVFLSIGYSTCHWCHVMEKESFEDEEVARLMNENFVCIKVDREERPDIDNLYMKVCQLLSKSGCGWPLNVVMTWDKKPFFVATYIPKETRFGRLGMTELIPRISNLWKTKKEEILRSAESIVETLKSISLPTLKQEEEKLDQLTLKKTFEQLKQQFDRTYGGFGEAPKFPTPHNLMYLLRYHLRSKNTEPLEMVTKTLNAMATGGIFDHIGFGFHRYSTDSRWFIPHFEKMLYDQALIAMAYTEGYQVTKEPLYKKTVQRVISYVLREMTSHQGAFYSAQDADSEGEEGKFYLWYLEEIEQLLGKKEAELFSRIFNVSQEGNYREEVTGKRKGTNILFMNKTLDKLSLELNIPPKNLELKVEKWRQKLFEARSKRVPPLKDDKILTDWNGLMIAAIAKAYKVLKVPEYLDAAERAIKFIDGNLTKGSKLYHRYRDNEAAIEANLDDYCFLTWGLIELYEATFKTKYLKRALELTNDMIKYFWDTDNGGFYFTPSDRKELIVRQKEIHDGAIPSGNSVAMLNLLRLSKITGRSELEDMAHKVAAAISPFVAKIPMSHTMAMMALDFALGPSYEIVIVGNLNTSESQSIINILLEDLHPNKVVIFKDTSSDHSEIERLAPYTSSLRSLNEKTTIYVCKNHKCSLPTTSIGETLRLLKT